MAGQITGALGFKLERVPYKGAPQMMPDLLEGRVQAAVLLGASMPHVRSGRLTMLGCSMAERIARLSGTYIGRVRGLGGPADHGRTSCWTSPNCLRKSLNACPLLCAKPFRRATSGRKWSSLMIFDLHARRPRPAN